MAKKKTVSKATVKRSTTSPYTSLPSALRFGPDRQTYYVPKPLLQSLGELSEHDPWDEASNLPDVDADSGHIIVHFLYTGTYQTLIDEGEDVTTSLYASKELLKAALVCMAAKKYKLTDLEELARAEMKQCGTNVSITELVQLISEETFMALSDDSPWLQDFLTGKVEVAIKSSDDVFLMMGFFASIASSSLARFLAQEVVSIYHKENLELRSKTALPIGHPSTTTASPDAKESCEAESKLPIATPSKKKKKMKKGIPPEPAGIIASLPEPAAVSFPEVGSVPEVESEPVKHSAPELVPEAEPAMVPEQEPETEATPTFDTPYGESIAIPEVDYTEAVCDPFAGLSKSQKKKLEKKMKEEARLAEKENERVAKAVEEAVYDFVPPEAPLPFASPVPEVEPVPEAEAEAEAAPEVEPECVAEDPPPPEPTLVVVEDPSWDDWGGFFGSSKKKKKDGAVFFNDTPAEQEAATGSDIVEEELPVDYTIITDPTIEVAVAHDTDECPRRVEHLSGRDGWRACASCELYVRETASRLYSAGCLDVNGLGTIK